MATSPQIRKAIRRRATQIAGVFRYLSNYHEGHQPPKWDLIIANVNALRHACECFQDGDLDAAHAQLCRITWADGGVHP